MPEVSDVLLLIAAGAAAGGLGAMVGIGGGVFLTPALVLGFGVPLHVAVAASLVGVIATSSAAGIGSARRVANMRLAMALEVPTTIGAIGGGLSAAVLPERTLSLFFSAFALFTAVSLLRWRYSSASGSVSSPAEGRESHEIAGGLGGGYVDRSEGGLVRYGVQRLPLGLAASFVAGNVSGLLGVGGGFLKVPVMALWMRVPLKVAAATSNFMIGVTAVASLAVYYRRGYLVPLVAGPVAVGAALGALAGSRVGARLTGRRLARVLAFVVLVAAVQMGLKGLGVTHGR